MSTPLPREVGTGSTMHGASGRASLSNTMQLAPARHDGEAVVAEHAVEVVGAETGGVDDPARADVAAIGAQHRALDADLDGRDPVAQKEVRAPVHGLGRVGEGGGPRADDRLVGDREPAERAGAEGRHASRRPRRRRRSRRGRSRCRGPSPGASAARRAPRRSTRRAAPRRARPACLRRRRTPRAARTRAARAGSRASRARRRSRCAGSRCWPCWWRRRRRPSPRSARR